MGLLSGWCANDGRSAWHEAVSRVHSRRRGADSQTNVKPQTLNPILKLRKCDFRPFSAKTPWKAPAFWVAGPAISKTALFGPNPLTRAPIFSASGRNRRKKLSEISGRIRVRVRDHPLFWGSKRAGLLRGLGPFSYIFLSFLPTSLSAARARARVSRAPNPKSGKMGNAPSRGFALNAVTARREKTTHRKTKIANHDRSIGFQGTGFAGLNALRGPRFARIISGARWWRFGDQQSQII
eukprot:GEMP01055500.1.p1 GENE.GEMP01055500.1~~GEMP01055500.1.p1  ORF type:complete len:238 (+),score=5.70 GEMP01055500.1:502-1215(+)